MNKFKVGDKVHKPNGYKFDGTVVSVFKNSKGETRIVAEFDYNGMLHIFSEKQLELRVDNISKCIGKLDDFIKSVKDFIPK
jgi:hypothetical protein